MTLARQIRREKEDRADALRLANMVIARDEYERVRVQERVRAEALVDREIAQAREEVRALWKLRLTRFVRWKSYKRNLIRQ